MGKNIDELYESISQELSNSSTTSRRLDEIVIEHLNHNFECELCEIFRAEGEQIPIIVASHINCLEATLDKLMEWAQGTGDPGWEVDILLSACKRSNFMGRWLDYVLDTAWIFRLQFERNLHFFFISALLESRELNEEEKSRIQEANEMESFPSKAELRLMGL